MGTDYYVVRNRPSIEDAIRIGKADDGWKFLFCEVHVECDPPIVWEKFEDVRDWLKKYTVDSKDYVIMDDCDMIVSYDELMDIIATQQLTDNPDDFRFCKNVGGYRFTKKDFWSISGCW